VRSLDLVLKAKGSQPRGCGLKPRRPKLDELMNN